MKRKVVWVTVLLWQAITPALSGAMTINETFGDARAIVYELPEAGGREGVVRFVESVRDAFFPDLEIIDATGADEDALREQLTGGYVLFADLSDRSALLRSTLAPLPLEFDAERLRFASLEIPVSGVQLMLVGRNPFTGDKVVVYAGAGNELVAGINQRFHGPRSFHVFRSGVLVKEGMYNERFELPPDRVPLAAAVEDVRQFFDSLERIHPDLLAKMSGERYRQLRRSTMAEVGTGLGDDGSIAIKELASLLYRAGAAFGDGHTSVDWSPRLDETLTEGVRFPAFLLEHRNGRFRIAASVDPDLDGKEVLSVDGKKTSEFLAPVLERCSAETMSFRVARFVSRQSFWYFLTDLLAGRDSLPLVVAGPGGAATEVGLPTLGYAEFNRLEESASAEKASNRRQTSLEPLGDGSVARLVYPRFELSDREIARIDEIFHQLKAERVGKLIIDIRGNSGGNSTMGDRIFRYISRRNVRAFSKVRIRISRDLIDRGGEFADARDLEGLVETRYVEEAPQQTPEAFFPGRIVLLVDGGSFSAAADFAAMFRDYEVGDIIGFETGGLAVSFGDVFRFQLANSGIPVGVSFKQFFGPRPRPGDDEHGVLPTLPVTDEVYRRYAEEADPVLAYAVDVLKEPGEPLGAPPRSAQ